MGGKGSKVDKSIGWVPGHAPTALDLLVSKVYATMRAKKEMCETNTTDYAWQENPALGYYCPEKLQGTCYNGQCRYTKQGCLTASYKPYYDCPRDDNGICDYKGKYWDVPDGSDCPAGTICKAGDMKLADYCCNAGEKGCKDAKSCDPNSDYSTCTDNQCVNKDGQTQSQVEGIDRTYLEWWDNPVTIGTTVYEGGRCLVTDWAYRRWCEMPWTRSAENMGVSEDLIKQVSPLHYDESSGTCRTTSDYCKVFGDGYGKSEDILGEGVCTGEHSKFDPDYDCCENIGRFIAELFFGRSISKLDIVVKRTLSDPRLKTNIDVVKRDWPMQGIDLCSFEWNDEAERIYGVKGKALGFMTDQLKTIAPQAVGVDENGYEYINPQGCRGDKNLLMVWFFASHPKLFSEIIETATTNVMKSAKNPQAFLNLFRNYLPTR